MGVLWSSASGRVDVVIDRPDKRNAITADMMRSIVGHVAAAAADDDVKVVVISATGPMFTSGYDITDPSDFAGHDDEPVRSRTAALAEKASWMADVHRSAKPVVMQIQGNCIGIGTMLLLVADFALVSDDAGFGFPEERFGSAGGTWVYPFLIRSIGLKAANDLVMTGRRVAADEALAMGLVNRVVPRDRLEEVTSDLVAALCSLPRDGIAINRAAKRLAMANVGFDQCFDVHAVVHPLAERIERGADEYDFMRSVGEHGMRRAVEERNQRFSGGWWGW